MTVDQSAGAQLSAPSINHQAMKNTRPADIFLRFLQLAEAVRNLPALPELDPLEERILMLVARAGQERERLSVRDMMAKHELGAPATVHSRLKSMREKGWIMLSDTEDTRRKQVELTQAALQHFDQLSRCMVKAAKTSR
jgi:DNA-binding MarR family transcriptional regulator